MIIGMVMKETKKRSLAKTITWRALGTTTILIITYLVTGDIWEAGLVSLIAMEAKVVLYFIHERIWNKVKWGYEK
ncbi:MAG: DUF2061 domain-containing protein [Candidatus Aenigmarchaeota archaeon]|nr:DUF2061 domain-containing protein [Candidatus Aenigmarchaeota archaeon]